MAGTVGARRGGATGWCVQDLRDGSVACTHRIGGRCCSEAKMISVIGRVPWTALPQLR